MSKKKEKTAAGSTPEETVVRLETRLKEFEERTAKKIKDLEDLVQYLTNKVCCKDLLLILKIKIKIKVGKHTWFFKRGE